MQEGDPADLVTSTLGIARLLNLSAVQVVRDRKDGRCGGIPFVRLGGRIVYPIRAVEAWLMARTQRGATSALVHGAPTTRRGRPTKAEQMEASARGMTVSQLRETA